LGLGLESKEGALRQLGEEFPEEKLAEIRMEIMEDAKAEGALTMVQTMIQKEIMDLTGMMPGPDGSAMPMDPVMLGDGDVMGDGIEGPPPQEGGVNEDVMQAKMAEQMSSQSLREDLVTRAYGTKIPQRRVPDEEG
jgi:hypothetical protein